MSNKVIRRVCQFSYDNILVWCYALTNIFQSPTLCGTIATSHGKPLWFGCQ